MTEFEMHEKICKELGIKHDTSQINNIIKYWNSGVIEYLNENNLNPLLGVKEYLEILTKGKNILGIVTGNPKRIGKAILKSPNLEKFFSIFSWGDNAQNRNEIVKNAINEAKLQGYDESNSKLFVFGDSPYDIKAGNFFNAYTIGVATGHYSQKKLVKAGANLVLKKLSDFQEFINKI